MKEENRPVNLWSWDKLDFIIRKIGWCKGCGKKYDTYGWCTCGDCL